MRDRSRLGLAVAATLAAMTAINPARADLVGDEIIAELYRNHNLLESVTETVLAGPEETGNWLEQIGYNIESSTITVVSLLSAKKFPSNRWVSGLSADFLDLDWVGMPDGIIVGAEVTASGGAGWSLIDDADVTFTDHSVSIDMDEVGGFSVDVDQFFTIQLITSHAPAPGGLALIGLAGLAVGRRRRRGQARR